jgi:hypothetical protein
MATTVQTVYNTGSQNLSVLVYPLPGVPGYESLGNAVAMTFNTVGNDVGTDATIDGVTGTITLATDVTFLITVHATTNSSTAGFYKFVDIENSVATGLPTPFGQTLSLTITPGVNDSTELTYHILACTESGADWLYPAQIQNATLIVQAISGFV